VGLPQASAAVRAIQKVNGLFARPVARARMMEHAPLAAVLVQRMLDCSAADHNMATMVSSAQSPQAS
jgi:hypothetical protein